jgi:adenine-specific DNA-methyltransferase
MRHDGFDATEGEDGVYQPMPIKTELVWDGKYDANGKRVAPLRVALPFQTVETVNESAQDRQLNLFQAASKAKPWRNRLIWGDKKYILPSLLAEFAGKINLIYIDPPFDTGADFSFTAVLPEVDDTDSDYLAFTKQPSIIERKAYRDTWGSGINSYLQWIYETLSLLHSLLSEAGALYLHLDWHVGNYAKIILDEIFGTDNYRNQIIWKRTTAHSNEKQGASNYGCIHDMIFFYSKTDKYNFSTQRQAYDVEYVESHYRHVEEGTGRRFRKGDLTANKKGGDTSYEWKGVRPYSGRYWAYSKEKMEEFERQGRLVYTSSGMPEYKRYLDEMPGRPIQDVWDDISPINSQAAERIGYPTQKPETLIERIIKSSSVEDDIILDCFVGSGTTAAVAERYAMADERIVEFSGTDHEQGGLISFRIAEDGRMIIYVYRQGSKVEVHVGKADEAA